jgi:hypothetical protein
MGKNKHKALSMYENDTIVVSFNNILFIAKGEDKSLELHLANSEHLIKIIKDDAQDFLEKYKLFTKLLEMPLMQQAAMMASGSPIIQTQPRIQM